MASGLGRTFATMAVVMATGGGWAAEAPRSGTQLDTSLIERLTGAKGKLAEGVFKVSVPRSDLQVTASGVRIVPAMGLTSWAAFEGQPGHVVVMGDLVLTEDQVNPVMTAALDSGLEVTALHNHFFRESPRVMFMHIGGMGAQQVLAAAVGKVFAKMNETSGHAGEGRNESIAGPTTVDGSRIDAILGVHGALDGGVYKAVFGRNTTMHGMPAGNAMGVNTWAAFTGSNERAVVDGDFAMLEGELQGVLRALRAANIDVVAIHQHMTGEQPRILFLHYWGVGSSEALARGLRAALDRTATPVGSR